MATKFDAPSGGDERGLSGFVAVVESVVIWKGGRKELASVLATMQLGDGADGGGPLRRPRICLAGRWALGQGWQMTEMLGRVRVRATHLGWAGVRRVHLTVAPCCTCSQTTHPHCLGSRTVAGGRPSQRLVTGREEGNTELYCKRVEQNGGNLVGVEQGSLEGKRNGADADWIRLSGWKGRICTRI